MAEHRDKPHVLILEGEGEEREWRVVHPPTCPWDAYNIMGPDDAPFMQQTPTGGHSFSRSCLTAYEVSQNGIDSLACDHLVPKEIITALGFRSSYESWRHIPAGRYTIECWSQWSGSMYDDADGGMDLVEDEEEPTGAVASCQ